ncbi:MAG: DUF2541 family protein [Bdellovibrionales bacterium]|nr:DUF2541 family protein [Bdellovibrionales bacterium]
MKAILFLGTLVFVASQAVANPDPKDIFNFVFDVIQDQINKDNGPQHYGPGHGYGPGFPGGPHHPGNPGPGWPPPPPPPVANKVILEQNGANLLLGRTFIQNKAVDSVDFPACNASANQRVTHLIVRAQQSAVQLNRVRVTYANGQEIVLLQNVALQKGQSTTWIPLDQARCVRKIRVNGEAFGPGPYSKTAVVSFIGYIEGY